MPGRFPRSCSPAASCSRRCRRRCAPGSPRPPPRSPSPATSRRRWRSRLRFFSRPLSCFRCHSGFNFSGGVDFKGRGAGEGEGFDLHNTGLYNIAGAFSYPSTDTGLYEITNKPADVGKFKAPTLRNIALTAPYMHDGSIATLEGVLDHYAAGGRTIAEGPNRGVGHDNPNKSPIIGGFMLNADQKADLLAFLNTLTDSELLSDPRLSNPWTGHR